MEFGAALTTRLPTLLMGKVSGVQSPSPRRYIAHVSPANKMLLRAEQMHAEIFPRGTKTLSILRGDAFALARLAAHRGRWKSFAMIHVKVGVI